MTKWLKRTTSLINVMKKDRYVKALIVMEIEFMIDKDTIPEDVLCRSGIVVDSDHGRIFHSNLIHSAVLVDEKLD